MTDQTKDKEKICKHYAISMKELDEISNAFDEALKTNVIQRKLSNSMEVIDNVFPDVSIADKLKILFLANVSADAKEYALKGAL